jgi:hypothetical protein
MRGAAMLPRSTACQPATHLAPARDAPLGISDAYVTVMEIVRGFQQNQSVRRLNDFLTAVVYETVGNDV